MRVLRNVLHLNEVGLLKVALILFSLCLTLFYVFTEDFLAGYVKFNHYEQPVKSILMPTSAVIHFAGFKNKWLLLIAWICNSLLVCKILNSKKSVLIFFSAIFILNCLVNYPWNLKGNLMYGLEMQRFRASTDIFSLYLGPMFLSLLYVSPKDYMDDLGWIDVLLVMFKFFAMLLFLFAFNFVAQKVSKKQVYQL